MSSRLRCAMLIQCVHIQKWKLWISVSLFAVAFIKIWQMSSMARTIRKWFVSADSGRHVYISAKTSKERTIERCKWLLLNVPTTRAYFKHSISSISSNNTAARFGHVANKLNGFVFIRCLFLVRQHIRFFIFTCYFNVNLCFFFVLLLWLLLTRRYLYYLTNCQEFQWQFFAMRLNYFYIDLINSHIVEIQIRNNHNQFISRFQMKKADNFQQNWSLLRSFLLLHDYISHSEAHARYIDNFSNKRELRERCFRFNFDLFVNV